jgi:hypothetical protein
MLLAGLKALEDSPSIGEDALEQAMARLPAGRVNFEIRMSKRSIL